MKNLLLFSIILTANSALGTPCTTAVGSAHVIATCALGNRTFSAFATSASAPMVGGRQEQGGETQPGVLVPLSHVQRLDGPAVARAILERVDAAAPERSDRGLHIARTSVTGTRNFEDSGQTLPVGGTGLDLVLADKMGSDWKTDDERDSAEAPTLLLPPDQGIEEDRDGPAGNPIVSLDLTEPVADFTETPEPATYALIGVGLIGLWGLSRRTVRRPDSD